MRRSISKRMTGVLAMSICVLVTVIGSNSPVMPADVTHDASAGQVGPVWAQSEPDNVSRAPLPGGPMGPPDFESQRRHIEQLRLLKLLEVLDLKESQEEGFITAFRTFRKVQRQLDSARREVLRDLSKESKSSSASDTKMNRLIDSTVGLDRQKETAARDFFAKARTMLTAQQAAKLVVFQQNFEYEMLERVREFRDRPWPSHGGKEPMHRDSI